MVTQLITGIRSKKIPVRKLGIVGTTIRVKVKHPLEELVFAVGHDPNDRWCSCSECCCVNQMCTHWDDL